MRKPKWPAVGAGYKISPEDVEAFMGLDDGEEEFIREHFGDFDGSAGDRIEYGSKGSLKFTRLGGKWHWKSHEIGAKGGPVADLMKDTALLAKVKATCSGDGIRKTLGTGWDGPDFEQHLWSQGVPVDQSDEASAYLINRKISPNGIPDSVVRRVMYRRKDSENTSPVLAWRREDGSFRIRALYGDHDRWSTTGKSSACIVLPGTGIPVLVEGQEDGLVAWQATGREVWIACGDMAIAKLPRSVDAVTVIMDNDTIKDNALTGSELTDKGAAIQANLERQGVISLGIGFPDDHKDLNDMVMDLNGSGKAAVSTLIEENTPEVDLVPLLEGAVVFSSLSQIADKELPPPNWLIPGAIERGDLCSLAGPSGVGKTRFFAAFIACAVTGTLDRMGLPKAAPFGVVWIANEEKVMGLQRRIKAAALHYDVANLPAQPFVIKSKDEGQYKLIERNEEGLLVVNQKALNLTVATARHVDAPMVVIDPLTTLSDGMDENSVRDVAILNDTFMSMTAQGLTVMSVHHTGKGVGKHFGGTAEAWRGSTAIYSPLDVGWTLSNAVQGTGKDETVMRSVIELKTGKQREGERLEPLMYNLTNYMLPEGYGVGVTERITSLLDTAEVSEVVIDRAAAMKLKDLLEDGMPVKELGDRMRKYQDLPQPQSDGRFEGEEKDRLVHLLGMLDAKMVQRAKRKPWIIQWGLSGATTENE